MAPDLLPALDPIPNPGPGWLFHVLLVLTFFLHLLFMNLTLGGTFMAAVAQLTSRGRSGDHRTVLAERLMGINTYGISFTITTGVAPLLFIQVLYQQTFYPATILIGTAWLGLLLFLAAGYYAAYLYKFKGAPAEGSGGTVWLVLAAVLFLAVAMIQVSVNLIHSQPETWTQVAGSGWSVLSDPTYVPRLLHFLLAGIGLSAAVVAWWAVRRVRRGEGGEVDTAIAGYAWTWAMGSTVLQVIDGFVLLLLLPRRVLLSLASGWETMVPLVLAVVVALGLLMMLVRIRNPVDAPGAVTGVLSTMGLVLAVMVITRHQARMAYLEPVASRFAMASAPQWLNFALFAVLLVVALGTVAFMVRDVLRSRATGAAAA